MPEEICAKRGNFTSRAFGALFALGNSMPMVVLLGALIPIVGARSFDAFACFHNKHLLASALPKAQAEYKRGQAKLCRFIQNNPQVVALVKEGSTNLVGHTNNIFGVRGRIDPLYFDFSGRDPYKLSPSRQELTLTPVEEIVSQIAAPRLWGKFSLYQTPQQRDIYLGISGAIMAFCGRMIMSSLRALGADTKGKLLGSIR